MFVMQLVSSVNKADGLVNASMHQCKAGFQQDSLLGEACQEKIMVTFDKRLAGVFPCKASGGGLCHAESCMDGSQHETCNGSMLA